MRGERVIRTAVIILMAVATTGCASALSQPMPEMKGRLSLKVSREQPWRYAFGVYQIPDTLVFVSGHQGAAADVGAAFGIIGALAAHAAAQSTGEKKTKDVQAELRLNMPALAERALADELAKRSDATRFALAGSPGDGSLEIVPYLVVNFIGDDQVRPWIVLNTALKDARGTEKWKTRYIVDSAESRLLGGESGWASSGGEPLRQAVDRGLHTGISVLLKDASDGLPRTGRTVKVKSNWVWVKEPLEVTARVLEETEDTLIVAPEVMDDRSFSGVNIFAKKSITVTAESTK